MFMDWHPKTCCSADEMNVVVVYVCQCLCLLVRWVRRLLWCFRLYICVRICTVWCVPGSWGICACVCVYVCACSIFCFLKGNGGCCFWWFPFEVFLTSLLSFSLRLTQTWSILELMCKQRVQTCRTGLGTGCHLTPTPTASNPAGLGEVNRGVNRKND